MNATKKTRFLLLLLVAIPSLRAADFKAGVARTRITPPLPIYLNGYAARTNPAAAVKTDLWAKALAVEDPQGARAVIVTTDLIGLPREVSEAVAERVRQKHGLTRAQVLLNSSHTHCGPVVWPGLAMFAFQPEEKAQILKFTRNLTENLTDIIGAALADLSPARLASAQGTADFAINRRQLASAGVRIGLNPTGPVDHGVPVLRVTAPDGALRAVLFGYACHNTTLGGDFNQVDGDYAGAAQRALEAAHPKAAALFMMLCGGDQNPHPRGNYSNVVQHGEALAASVEQVLAGEMKPLRPPLRAAWRTTELEFESHDRQTFEQEARNPDVFRQRRARAMLTAYDQGRPPRRLLYPVQAIRFHDDFTLLGLGGEVVVDYPIRARREYPREHLVVAGYCNDVSCYIPSLRVLREGGYEPVHSMIYYGQPGPFTEAVEETVFRCVREVLAAAGANP
jgi:neutral ceramidase